MAKQQTFVAVLCLLLAQQQINAVVNKPQNVSEDGPSAQQSVASKEPEIANLPDKSSADSVAASTDQDASRRETPVLTDSYGTPLAGGLDSYVPSGASNQGLPIPVYGVPDGPQNNLVYPAPPPDIPPPLPSSASIYGPPQPVDLVLPLPNYGPPPAPNYGPPPSPIYGPPPAGNYGPPPPLKYGPPVPQRLPKPFAGPSFHKPHKFYGPPPPPPRPQYGPPSKPLFVPKHLKPVYGPPKIQYGGSNKNLHSKPIFLPQKPIIGPGPLPIYGPPHQGHHEHHQPTIHYGPPEPVPHGPPHPGAPAPPTPPDIKYDGWQPIPGLVSRPPSDSYDVPDAGQHHGIGDMQFNSDFTPPPVGGGHSLAISSHSAHLGGLGYSSSLNGVSDSYGAPLNAVTGSGGVGISSSGDIRGHSHDQSSLSLGLSLAGIDHTNNNQLSVVKSIGYELFPNVGGSHLAADSYNSPPLNSYSINGPYAAAHSYKSNGISPSFGSLKSNNHNFHGPHSGSGLIPPSGVYGVPPSGQYGTALLVPPSPQYGAPLNALKINPPKHPVVFREPVPSGLIQSIGQATAQKDAQGIVEEAHSGYNAGPSYIPPPVPDQPAISKHPGRGGGGGIAPRPSTLYTLPSSSSPISFQSVAHGLASGGLGHDFSSSFNLNSAAGFGGAHASALTSYSAPLGSIDGSYGLPLHHSAGLTVGLDHSHPPVTIDLTKTTGIDTVGGYQSGGGGGGVQHDCTLHKSQPLPSLSYGVPSASSYTASLSSLTTNIEGAYHGPPPPPPPPLLSLGYGAPDLSAAHSQTVNSGASINAIENETHGKNYGKSIAESFGDGSELIKSESIDINNIPVQGNLGTYTLQIQPADGLGGALPPDQVPHAHVLNDGLLQSILAAIEQPQPNGAAATAATAAQPLIIQPGGGYEEPPTGPTASGAAAVQDAELQHSVKSAVVLPAPAATETPAPDTAAPTTAAEAATDAASLHLIDNNEIALYFSNKEGATVNTNNTGEVGGAAVRNGQQYGSYVTFKSPASGYVYGDATDKADKNENPYKSAQRL